MGVIVTRTAARLRAFIAIVCFPCKIAYHVRHSQHGVMDEQVVCLKDILYLVINELSFTIKSARTKELF